MIYFVEGFAKSKSTKYVYPKIAAFQDLLLIGSVGSRTSVFHETHVAAHTGHNLVEVFGYIGSNYVLHHFTQNTC